MPRLRRSFAIELSFTLSGVVISMSRRPCSRLYTRTCHPGAGSNFVDFFFWTALWNSARIFSYSCRSSAPASSFFFGGGAAFLSRHERPYHILARSSGCSTPSSV